MGNKDITLVRGRASQALAASDMTVSSGGGRGDYRDVDGDVPAVMHNRMELDIGSQAEDVDVLGQPLVLPVGGESLSFHSKFEVIS